MSKIKAINSEISIDEFKESEEYKKYRFKYHALLNKTIKSIQNIVFESQEIELKMKLGLIHQDYETLLSATLEKILSIIAINIEEERKWIISI